MCLGAALQLGVLRMTGTTLAAMDYVRRAVLKHFGTQLQCLAPEIASLRALYRVERTLYAHQSWACAWAGYRWPDRVDADAVIQILADGTAVTLDSKRLAQQVREALVQRHCLIPRQQSLGQLLRTTYLCDYFSLPDFRRPLYRVLERGESVHALQRQICTQPLPAKRGRRVEELIATSGALTLLTNCVMAWNTLRLERALDREGQHVSPRHLVDALSHIGPVGHKHINFRGIYRFPVERYSARLVASAARHVGAAVRHLEQQF